MGTSWSKYPGVQGCYATVCATLMYKHGMLSLERCGDQQHRRRACSEFVADRAKVLMLEVILFYKFNFTSKERFHAGRKTRFTLSNHSMKLS